MGSYVSKNQLYHPDVGDLRHFIKVKKFGYIFNDYDEKIYFCNKIN